LAAEGGSKMPKEKCVELIRNLVKEETGKNPNKLIIKCETSSMSSSRMKRKRHPEDVVRHLGRIDFPGAGN